VIRGAAVPGPAVFGGPQLVGVENFYVLYVTTETCKMWALTAAEQPQK